jgi:hypothetical protein
VTVGEYEAFAGEAVHVLGGKAASRVESAAVSVALIVGVQDDDVGPTRRRLWQSGAATEERADEKQARR